MHTTSNRVARDRNIRRVRTERIRSGHPVLARGASLLSALLAALLLSYCGGETDNSRNAGGTTGSSAGGTTGSSAGGTTGSNVGGTTGSNASGRGGTGGTAGTGGFSGHTGHCINDPCGGGCGYLCPDAARAGTGGGGFSGHTSGCLMGCGASCGPCLGGRGGTGGLGGFSGHTSGCLNTCGGPCPPCPTTGGTSSEAGADAADSADASVDGASDSAAASIAARASVPEACYALAGYEPDPCLPADDSILSWLSDLPTGCQPEVAGGPFLRYDGKQRTCCYAIACR
jgi:hypothetical protein